MDVSEHSVVLPTEITLRNIEEISSALKDYLENSDAPVVDLRGVSLVDVSILQLLAAFNVSAASRGRKVTLLSQPGSPFDRAAAAAGFLEMRSAGATGARGAVE